MSHPIYYASIINEIRYLEQLAVASKQFISVLGEAYSKRGLDGTDETSPFSFEVMSYQDWLIETVSSSLISSATRIRVLQDSYDFSIEDNPGYSADIDSCENFKNIVKVENGNFKLSIRECCNKIIHATVYELEFQKDSDGTEYWNGWCILKGEFQKKKWHIKLNIINFSFAVRHFIDCIKHL